MLIICLRIPISILEKELRLTEVQFLICISLGEEDFFYHHADHILGYNIFLPLFSTIYYKLWISLRPINMLSHHKFK